MRHSMPDDQTHNGIPRRVLWVVWTATIFALTTVELSAYASPQDVHVPKVVLENAKQAVLVKCFAQNVNASIASSRQLGDVRGCNADSISEILREKNIAASQVMVASSFPNGTVDSHGPIAYAGHYATITLYVSTGSPPKQSVLDTALPSHETPHDSGTPAQQATPSPNPPDHPPQSPKESGAKTPADVAKSSAQPALATPAPSPATSSNPPSEVPGHPARNVSTYAAATAAAAAAAAKEKPSARPASTKEPKPREYGDTIEVPLLSGLTVDQADQTLTSASLRRGATTYKWQRSNGGRVFQQNPSPYTRVAPNSEVSVWVAQSPPRPAIYAALATVALGGWLMDKRRVLIRTKRLVHMKPRWADGYDVRLLGEIRIHGKELGLRPRLEPGTTRYNVPIRIAH